ncbi:uncharacterized protein [Physcomitrium patens]|uniref:ALOG domain-containing protein n=1 Tax=Physcomitrium patens TaxID=3218 RepID=A0A2K1IG14_PHYPA|nr:protein LIGHT-DEPENDENT SHORT HYPOCOTYLS 4-like [Physcomitrium patens]XP_024364752.1 protein LIGHT-DEPENDENT SHORT HYPOCOTYLS 4-like [Physcomitrium patens]XP_024364753.1 protein LIGHT-DEPENDENT SHORT HYPOCOTYLS 4-like [Physcomitrium patens]XP_024364754.1 protein LIGHT-DEPENDENT SHORT HYPOCOTYLS 4-like [Physcomitrium patens]XP_024364755.1 protein LIGHT-DEPENDENT SHORT HYPOCOTYLS 4-like [Physcomitrium patens]XP_024364756.1 protein LIGHT-DEPENDENT SHORT HYPOCOTYLS 4-like [Physcomitrium patens]|eukprot:XP_024364750.1 protein LIGHT-DEPENDENT SHORT HYPOCOTYLS 4-like [Physcomitrella patens]
MMSEFHSSEFRNLLNIPPASSIHPGDSSRFNDTTAFQFLPGEQYINALHRDSKPFMTRDNDFASRIQSLMNGEVALDNNLEHNSAGPSSGFMRLPGQAPNGTVSSREQVDHQHEQNTGVPSRYEAQKRRDWNTFGQYLRNHRPPLALARCTGLHVLEFVRYLDQFGKTKVHIASCSFFGLPHPPHPCPCPLRQAWGSLDALIGRLRAAFEENGGKPESNPFGARQVRLYLREVREMQAKARGIAYEKKKRKRIPPPSELGGNGVNVGMIVNIGAGGMSNGNVHPLPAQQ